MELLSDYDKYVVYIYDNLCGFQRNILLALAVPLGKKIEHAYQKESENLLIPLVTKHLLWYNLA